MQQALVTLNACIGLIPDDHVFDAAIIWHALPLMHGSDKCLVRSVIEDKMIHDCIIELDHGITIFVVHISSSNLLDVEFV